MALWSSFTLNLTVLFSTPMMLRGTKDLDDVKKMPSQQVKETALNMISYCDRTSGPPDHNCPKLVEEHFSAVTRLFAS